jgi:putative transposase
LSEIRESVSRGWNVANNKKYVELLWAEKYDKYEKGKRKPIEKPNLPFQVVETVNELRNDIALAGDESALESFLKICNTFTKMKKAFQYKLLANSKTFQKAELWLNLCPNLYNTALERRISIYNQNKGSISKFDQMRQLPELKREFPEFKQVGSQVLQDVIERLDRAYKAFFKRVKNRDGKAGFPRFKSRNRYDSFTLKQCGWKLEGKYLTVRNIGTFKLYLSRPIEGDIKTVTIRKTPTSKWFVCFSCDNVPEREFPETNKEVGIDVGIKSFLADSEGNFVENPEYFRRSERLLGRRQRRLNRRKRGSNRRDKAHLLVAKAQEKVANQRNDFLDKVANYYILNFKNIFIGT